jgi:hypothetical protein
MLFLQSPQEVSLLFLIQETGFFSLETPAPFGDAAEIRKEPQSHGNARADA